MKRSAVHTLLVPLIFLFKKKYLFKYVNIGKNGNKLHLINEAKNDLKLSFLLCNEVLFIIICNNLIFKVIFVHLQFLSSISIKVIY